MCELAKGLRDLLSYERFRFSLKVTSFMVLPPYKGSVFRGAFGNAFRRIVCALPKADCKTCMVRRQCIYTAIFEPQPPPDYPDAAKFSNPPPPYVLNPPLTNRQFFHPQEILDFELVLIGRAIEALPYFIYTFMELGRQGLGRERGKYQLLQVDVLRGCKATQIYDGATETLTAYIPKEDTAPHQGDDRVDAHTLHFLTPLRLKLKGDLVTRLTFPILFERLANRLKLLTTFYGFNGNLPVFPSLIAQAKEIKVSSDELHWYDWERYSGRQKTTMKLGGLKGNICFTGEFGPFLPFLRMGERVNVGQGTTFGLGKYEMDLILHEN